MKKLLLSALAVSFLLVGAAHADHHTGMNVDEKVQKLKTKLNLTDDQANSIKPIISEYKDRVEQAEKDKKEKFSKVLTPEQLDKLEDWKDEKKEMHKEIRKEMKEQKGN